MARSYEQLFSDYLTISSEGESNNVCNKGFGGLIDYKTIFRDKNSMYFTAGFILNISSFFKFA